VHGPGYETVNVTFGKHHCGQYDGVIQLCFGHWRGQSLVLTSRYHGVDVVWASLVRVDDFKIIGQRQVAAGGDSLDIVAFANQDAVGNAALLAKVEESGRPAHGQPGRGG
jgi:hypothetical protein